MIDVYGALCDLGDGLNNARSLSVILARNDPQPR